MENINNDENTYFMIDEDMIQDRAINTVDRMLTKQELDEVIDQIWDDSLEILAFVSDCINKVVDEEDSEEMEIVS